MKTKDPGWPDVSFWDSSNPRLYAQQGRTQNFLVYYERSLGDLVGSSLAAGVLLRCEADYQKIRALFSGVNPPNTPYTIYIDAGSFGAFHWNCRSTDIHCAAFDGQSVDLVRMLIAAEVSETFMAARPGCFDCKSSTGEGLSRVIAGELYPVEINSYGTSAVWLDSARPDWISRTEPTDTNPVSVGCSTLYLNYLRYALGYNWQEIIRSAAPTLAETRTQLTGRTSGAYVGFITFIQRRYPQGVPSGLHGDNPFPLPGDPAPAQAARWGFGSWPPSWA